MKYSHNVQSISKLLIAIIPFIFCSSISARIPEPDNIIYGTLTYNNQLATSSNTELTVRFELFGSELATYQMGSENIGDNYVLRIPIDVLDPRNALTARPGETGDIFISKVGVNIPAGTFVVGERGTIQVVNISGINTTDSDGDGMPDDWEVQYGLDPYDNDENGNFIIDSDDDFDSDGVTNLNEFLSGTDPTAPLAVADGDLNLDGIVNVVDVLIGQQILSGQVVPTAEQLTHGDVAPLVAGVPSPDGQFNAGDLVVIQRKALGEISF